MTFSEFDAPTLAEAEQALFYLDAGCAREEWVQMGMALKSEFGEDGFTAWDDWSRQSEAYKANDARDVWRSIKGAGGITIASLFFAAIESGWAHERSETADEQAKREQAAADRAEANRARQEQEAADKVALQNRVAEVCRLISNKCLSRDGEAPYLPFKEVEAFGVGFVKTAFIVINNLQDNTVGLLIGASFISRFFSEKAHKTEDISFRWVKPGCLVVPLKDADGKLWNFQLIYAGGKGEKPGERKAFLKGGRKKGLFHIIEGSSHPAWGVAEGYATAATCHMAVGWTIAVAFDAGNLKAACEAMIASYPDSAGFVLGDDDVGHPDNPGRKKAMQIAAKLGLTAVFPNFDVSEKAAS